MKRCLLVVGVGGDLIHQSARCSPILRGKRLVDLNRVESSATDLRHALDESQRYLLLRLAVWIHLCAHLIKGVLEAG